MLRLRLLKARKLYKNYVTRQLYTYKQFKDSFLGYFDERPDFINFDDTDFYVIDNSYYFRNL